MKKKRDSLLHRTFHKSSTVYLVTVWQSVIVICDTPQASFWINEILRGLTRAVKLVTVKLAYCPLGSGEKVQNRFSTWLLGQPSWISDQNDFSYFNQQVPPILPIKFRVNGLSIQEKKFKIDFQDGNCGDHLVFLIGAILAIFDLQVTLMILTKFQVKWTYCSGEEAKNRFARWPSWIFYQNHFSYFDLPVTPMLSTKFQVNWPFSSEEEAKNRWWPSWIFDQTNFLSTNHPKASYSGSSQLAFWFRKRNEKKIIKMAILDFWSEWF